MKKCNDLFADMLEVMAKNLNYSFDPVLFKKGYYFPDAHGNYEQDQQAIRRSLIEVLSGNQPISMNIKTFPVSEEATSAQVNLQSKILNVLDGKGSLHVTITNSSSENEAV